MNQNARARLARAIAIATTVLCAGLLISFGRHATWWLLAMAVLTWLQTRRLRRDISTSGLPLQIFHIAAWSLLGLAVVGLLPTPTRTIGDAIVLLVAAGLYIRASTRRIR
ncbi:hypothetical protein K2Z83_03985 [Oscillochloris sp. ZM17-4]|uniref:hypothetical protein n=1 Tax=Oscillochloris sp. ZM17-4 TaxID=2866714 RepID=UPI001C73805F|nr:hypothetical protein [Oscillochloris sp. ZM17-4]MBX0326842.1 hypothetical protein [Oscillochloris sp. ZM17-4]